MKTAIVCGTPYQVFNALNMIYNGDTDIEQFDIFIFNRFKEAVSLVNNLKSVQGIAHTFLLNDYQKDIVNGRQLKGFIKNCHSAYIYLRPYNSLKYYFEKKKDWEYVKKRSQYDRILAPTPSFFLQCLEKINEKAILDYYEDGLGSYTGNFNSDYASKGRKIFAKIFKVGYNVIPVRNLYVYEPELCNSTVADNLSALPKPTSDFINTASKVFEYGLHRFNGNEMIWLGQRKVNDTVIKILNSLKTSKRKIIIRKHPKDYSDDIYQTLNLEIDSGEYMWELLLANSEMSNLVLISSYSTATFTPKMLFDKEPYVILVYKLFQDINPVHLKKTEYFVKKLKKIYIDKSKIIIPDSFEAFSKIIENV